MSYSSLSHTIGQRTPDVLRQSQRIRDTDYRGDRTLRHDTSMASQRQHYVPTSYTQRSTFIDQEPSSFYTSPLIREGRTSYQDSYSQSRAYPRRSDEGLSTSHTRPYQPMEPIRSSYPSGSSAYETYVPRPVELMNIIFTSYILNGVILFITTLVFLYLNLTAISCLFHQEWSFSLDTWQFVRAFLFLGAVLVARSLMLQHYDLYVNWNDVVRDFFSTGPMIQILLVFSAFAIAAYTYDIFTFFVHSDNMQEISQIIIICIINSILSLRRMVCDKQYLLDTCGFETTWSYLSEYRLSNLFKVIVQYIAQSLKVVLITGALCYVGIISFVFEQTFPIFSEANLKFPGASSALIRLCSNFVGLWFANSILEIQIRVMKRIWIRVLGRIGNTHYSLRPLYYFNTKDESEDSLISHCLRFLDSKLRYESRNSLLRRQNPGDVESKTIWHVLVDNTLERLHRINNHLQTLKASNLVMTGRFGYKNQGESFLLTLEYIFTSPPDVKDLRGLYHDICIATHEFKVINRVFRQMKVINLDANLRNFNNNLQTYYQGIFNALSTLQQIQNINQSGYVEDLLTDIIPFREVIKEGLWMLDKFLSR